MTNHTEDDDGDVEYDLDRVVTRAEGAATLRRLADGVATGDLTLVDREIAVDVPDQFELEVEYEADDEAAELETELAWPVEEGEPVAAELEADSDTEDEAVEVVDTASKAHFELYQDSIDEWRWRLVHDNGNIIADSGEGYSRKSSARKGLESVKRNAPGAAIVETPE